MKKIQTLFIPTNGEAEQIIPKCGDVFTTEELNFIVEGDYDTAFIEPNVLGEDTIVVYNFDFQVLELPLNKLATEICGFDVYGECLITQSNKI